MSVLETHFYFIGLRSMEGFLMTYDKEKKRIRDAKYRARNREKLSKKAAAYHKMKYDTDNLFRIKCNLRRRLRIALQRNKKSAPTLKLVGCSVEILKHHLQSQFQKGMTWDNYGEWHIDHRLPCVNFDLSKPEEQRRCFHYSNLQPLWSHDNLSKGAKAHVSTFAPSPTVPLGVILPSRRTFIG